MVSNSRWVIVKWRSLPHQVTLMIVSYLFRTPRKTMLFSGDTLFFGGRILLSNVYDCNVQDSVCSLRKLARRAFDALFPGHGLWSVQGATIHLKAAIDALDRLLLPPNLI